jgi:DNA-directed RNA polymerase sigma subunit (sigma70/sigma32)
MISVMAIYRRIATRKGEEKALKFLHWVIERYRLHDLWTVISHGKIEEEVADYRKESSISSDEIERMHLLSDREQLVIRFRYGINTQERTLEYIAENLLDGISRERVRQIEANAIRKLRGQ